MEAILTRQRLQLTSRISMSPQVRYSRVLLIRHSVELTILTFGLEIGDYLRANVSYIYCCIRHRLTVE